METELDLGINGYARFELFGKTFFLTNTHIAVIVVVALLAVSVTASTLVISTASVSWISPVGVLIIIRGFGISEVAFAYRLFGQHAS